MKKSLLIIPFLAVALSLQAEGLYKDQARSYREKGYALQMSGDLDEALSYYQKAVEMDPQYIEVYNDLGVVYESGGDLDRAIAMYTKALEIDANYLPAYSNLAFAYEKKGDIVTAGHYWQKRYELGPEGDYWTEVSRQHLLRLGTFPELQRKMMEKQAILLSQDLVSAREQERLELTEEAKLHFSLGTSFMKNGNYSAAVKEFESVAVLNPPDPELIAKARELGGKAAKIIAKNEAKAAIQEAVNYIDKDDYLAAGEKLKESLSSVLANSRTDTELR